MFPLWHTLAHQETKTDTTQISLETLLQDLILSERSVDKTTKAPFKNRKTSSKCGSEEIRPKWPNYHLKILFDYFAMSLEFKDNFAMSLVVERFSRDR